MHPMEQDRNLAAVYPVFAALDDEDQKFIARRHEECRFSFQQLRQLVDTAADLRQWREGPLSAWWRPEVAGKASGKARTKLLVNDLLDRVAELRRKPTCYEDFTPPEILPDKLQTIIDDSDDIQLLGRCPCPVEGEKTRCCNLKTLDAVQQCGFACAYCSIQSFYHRHEIRFVGDLEKRLEQLKLEPGTWHIGTGQSSDSLLWGDDHGTLTALAKFADKHPDVVVELKTKSARTDWMKTVALPRNIVSTWSLNARTIIDKEEHLTASLGQRIAAARRVADAGLLVGFHIHPMVHFEGWRRQYEEVVHEITENFAPEEVVMISIGTLTFTKQVLRQLRTAGRPSRILEMELTEAAGKYSYPLETKREMFSHVYSCFPTKWKETPGGPFFYLCMEDPSLWEPAFGYCYGSDREFEEAMKAHYQKKTEIS